MLGPDDAHVVSSWSTGRGIHELGSSQLDRRALSLTFAPCPSLLVLLRRPLYVYVSVGVVWCTPPGAWAGVSVGENIDITTMETFSLAAESELSMSCRCQDVRSKHDAQAPAIPPPEVDVLEFPQLNWRVIFVLVSTYILRSSRRRHAVLDHQQRSRQHDLDTAGPTQV